MADSKTCEVTAPRFRRSIATPRHPILIARLLARGALMKVGFIGLGNMGLGMSANLLNAGHELTVYNRTADKAKKLVEQGAKSAAAVADACKGDVVITMLADDSALEHVVFDDGGMISSLVKGAIHVSASTVSVALADRVAAEHTKRGQRFVSAPVFGRPEAAAAAKLFVVAAGAGGLGGGGVAFFLGLGGERVWFG